MHWVFHWKPIRFQFNNLWNFSGFVILWEQQWLGNFACHFIFNFGLRSQSQMWCDNTSPLHDNTSPWCDNTSPLLPSVSDSEDTRGSNRRVNIKCIFTGQICSQNWFVWNLNFRIKQVQKLQIISNKNSNILKLIVNTSLWRLGFGSLSALNQDQDG